MATKWNPIYWNTACLIVNSASLEEENEDEDFETKEKSSDYAKIAKAIGDITSRGIKVSLVDINKSNYSFEPDIENNEILFGMKALNGIGGPIIEQIITNRPYTSFKDFISKCPLNRTAILALIKSGAFDRLEFETEWAKELGIHPRFLVMTYYLSKVSDPKSKLTLQNFNGLLQRGLVPDSLDLQKRLFHFNKYLKDFKKGQYYVFDSHGIAESFYNKHFDLEQLDIINGVTCIKQTVWDKIYQREMDAARDWLKNNQEEILKKMNFMLFKEVWDKYAQGSLSAWEMESLCFYYHEHELINVDTSKYGIVNFFDLPEQPEVDYFFKRNGKDIPIYKTYKIIGTVISKNDARSSISLLTTQGVVNVKFTKEYFAMFGRQISEKQEDGTKKVVEKGWFQRGTKVMCTGFRRDDMFVTKSYSHTLTHQLYKIIGVNNLGEMELTHDRYKQGE